MSSSGEEVELEPVEDDGEHEKVVFHWSNEHVKKLVRYVASKLAPPDDLAPFNSVIINWDEVEDAVGVESAKCQHKWQSLLNSVRTYRTMPEVTMDILSQFSKSDVIKYNRKIKAQKLPPLDGSISISKKKKKKVNPAHPVRPKTSGYSVFCSKMMGSVQQAGLKGVPLMYKLAAMWKELPEKERSGYNIECAKQKDEYLPKVQEYAKNHPEDKEIKQILAEEMARVKNSNVRSSKTLVKKLEPVEETADLTQETLDDTASSADSSVLSPRKSPKKKRHAEDSELSQDSTPSKKKKKKGKVWTAEELYMEVKFDDYKNEHPDLSSEELKSKLIRKFNKMSKEKTEKYKRKAEERNS